jgi:hypothetical protein
MSVMAAQAGKDIWCEKPMTRTIGEGRRVMEAVKANGRIFRLNTWFRFQSVFYGFGTKSNLSKRSRRTVCSLALKAVVGETTGFTLKFGWSGLTNLAPEPVPDTFDYDLWLGPAPYKPYNHLRTHSKFRGYWDYDGGGLGDMGQHYLDPVQYLLEKDETSPVKIEIDAPPQHPDAVGSFRRITYTYADGCQIVLDGDNSLQGAPFLEGPRGNVWPKLKSDLPNLEARLSELPEPAPQQTDFVESVKLRRTFALNERNGFRSATLVNLGKVAMRLGRVQLRSGQALRRQRPRRRPVHLSAHARAVGAVREIGVSDRISRSPTSDLQLSLLRIRSFHTKDRTMNTTLKTCLLLAFLLALGATAQEDAAEETAAQWAEKQKTALAAINDASLAETLKQGAPAFEALFAQIKTAGASDALASTRIAALSQYVMVPGRDADRAAIADAILAAAQRASDADVVCFFLNQLRWCGLPRQADAVRAFEKAAGAGVADFAAMAVQAVTDDRASKAQPAAPTRAAALNREFDSLKRRRSRRTCSGRSTTPTSSPQRRSGAGPHSGRRRRDRTLDGQTANGERPRAPHHAPRHARRARRQKRRGSRRPVHGRCGRRSRGGGPARARRARRRRVRPPTARASETDPSETLSPSARDGPPTGTEQLQTPLMQSYDSFCDLGKRLALECSGNGALPPRGPSRSARSTRSTKRPPSAAIACCAKPPPRTTPKRSPPSSRPRTDASPRKPRPRSRPPRAVAAMSIRRCF